MKKLLSIAFAALLITACGSSNSQARPASDKTQTEQNGQKQEKTIHLTKAEFLQKVYNYETSPGTWKYEGDKPCIVDFYADWCGPCRMVSPVLEELAAQYKDEIIVYKINVDKEKELAGVFGVRSIPTILFVPKEGKPMLAQGALPKEEFVKQIDSFLLKK